jgi:hypothetical protein
LENVGALTNTVKDMVGYYTGAPQRNNFNGMDTAKDLRIHKSTFLEKLIDLVYSYQKLMDDQKPFQKTVSMQYCDC